MPPKSKLWGHVRVQSEKDEHGNVEMECVHCQLSFSGNENRIGHHLAGTGSNITACEMCPPDVADEAKTALNRGQLQKKLQVKISRSRSDSKIDLASDTDSPPKAAKYTTAGTASIKSLLSKQTKHEVDRAVARFFFATGCSFNRLQSPYFDEMLAAVAKYGPGYKRPNIHDLRGKLLEEEVQAVEKLLASTVLDILETTGCTLASDGWSSVDNRPLLNVMLVTPKGACFRKAIDTSGQVKDAEYVAGVVEEAINEAGAENIVQVVMDGAAVCIAAGRILEDRFRNITFTRCTAHTLAPAARGHLQAAMGKGHAV